MHSTINENLGTLPDIVTSSVAHKILLLDHDEQEAGMVVQSLGGHYDISWFDTMQDNVSTANDDFDLALLDLHMPDCEGLKAYRDFRDRNPKTPVVILSDRVDEPWALQALCEGAVDVLPKDRLQDVEYVLRSIKFALHREHWFHQPVSVMNYDVAPRYDAVFKTQITHELLPTIESLHTMADIFENELFGELGDDRYREYAELMKKCASSQLAWVKQLLQDR
ncbi:MAG: response regulator [Alphaproteobacteria bacterium]